jgi:hypothetical protein
MKRWWVLALALAAALVAAGCDGDDDDSADDDASDDDTAVTDDDSAGDDDDSAAEDLDGDGYPAAEDCDDGNADVYPGAEQVCDDVLDNDCDGLTDEAEEDADLDGFSECTGDCNLFNPAIHPGAEQVCFDDILDNDCDGLIDANETDGDSDDFTDCEGDCDDTEAEIWPGAWDVEDGIDNDCDGVIDEDVIDCDLVPANPTSETIMPGARAYHGLAIDQDGFIVGSDGNSLIKADYTGTTNLFTPNTGSCEQITYMPDGTLVIVSTNQGALMTIDATGIPVYLTASHGAYGLIYGPDDFLYTAGSDGIRRIDPATGDSSIIANVPQTAHTVAFNADASKMYIGTIGGGQLYEVELDMNLDPVGSPQVLAQFGGWHDGVGVDACGYIFVADYSTSSLYRVSPDGQQSLHRNWGWSDYGHGLIWGNGIGGWRSDSLYVPLPYNGNQVKEVVVEVPSCTWGGTVHNGP